MTYRVSGATLNITHSPNAPVHNIFKINALHTVQNHTALRRLTHIGTPLKQNLQKVVLQ